MYDKALFRGGAAAEAIYRPTRTQEDEWGDEEAVIDKVTKASRFKPGDKGFDGADGGDAGGAGGRGRPVEFEQEDAADPFGACRGGLRAVSPRAIALPPARHLAALP